jgi:hypothetical protein
MSMFACRKRGCKNSIFLSTIIFNRILNPTRFQGKNVIIVFLCAFIYYTGRCFEFANFDDCGTVMSFDEGMLPAQLNLPTKFPGHFDWL